MAPWFTRALRSAVEPLTGSEPRPATASTKPAETADDEAAMQKVLEKHPALRSYDGQQVVVGIRPEDFEDAAFVTNAPADRRLRARSPPVEMPPTR